MNEDLLTKRDELAQKYYDEREKVFDMNDFDKEVIATESYRRGFSVCYDLMQAEIAKREAGLTLERDQYKESSDRHYKSLLDVSCERDKYKALAVILADALALISPADIPPNPRARRAIVLKQYFEAIK